MFCIGKVDEIKHPYGRKEYGFISQFSPTRYKDVYFRVEDIFPGSDVKNEYPHDPYVGYFLVDDPDKPGEQKAVWVILIKEMNPSVLYKLINAYDLGGKEVSSLMIRYCSTQCLGDNPMDYIRFLREDTVREKLIQKAASHTLSASFCKAAIECLKKGWGNVSDIIKTPIYQYEPEEEVAKLCVHIKQYPNEYDISPILNAMPDNFLLREDIISLIGSMEIYDIISSETMKDQKVLLELASGLTNLDDREEIVSMLPADVILTKKELTEVYDDEKLAEWIGTSWDPIIIGNYALLKYIEEDEKPKTAVVVAEKAIQQGDCFRPEIWNNISDSCKVRLIIYLSNFPMAKKTYEKAGELAVDEGNNKLIRGMLNLLKIHYHTSSEGLNAPRDQLQKLFETGHNLIMDYITEYCFPTYILQGVPVPHDLNSLLEKCASNYKLRKYYCDVRIWNVRKENRTTVFCPRGKHFHLEGHECDYRNVELTQTKYTRTNRYEFQFLVDFIKNLHFEPNILFMCTLPRNGGINRETFRWAEYPYKISAYVNMLINFVPHMHCRCGAILEANKAYSKKIDARVPATMFYCPVGKNLPEDERALHDMDVYLNYCNNCEDRIDSRECHWQEPSYNDPGRGYYHCMFCGKAEYETRCPYCGEDKEEQITFAWKKPITCRSCGHSGDNWRRIRIEHGVPLRFEEYHPENRPADYPANPPREELDVPVVGFQSVDTDELPF